MPWTYHQRTGRMEFGKSLVGTGYSGKGTAMNNPAKEKEKAQGPIPRGKWAIGRAYQHKDLGKITMSLGPVGHDAHGRTAFRIHGDNRAHNNTASSGCIILGPTVRSRIDSSADRVLEVVE